MHLCCHCGKSIEDYVNYCSWDCIVNSAKADGGEIHTPNNLPVKCVKCDGSMWEHEHGDHPDYKFPVDVEFVKVSDDCDDSSIHDLDLQSHALIYTDGYVSVTIHECCYYMWTRHGKCMHSPEGVHGYEQRFTEESVKRIEEYMRTRRANS
jgi:hypothetical protein